MIKKMIRFSWTILNIIRLNVKTYKHDKKLSIGRGVRLVGNIRFKLHRNYAGFTIGSHTRITSGENTLGANMRSYIEIEDGAILEIKDNFSIYKGIKSSLLWGNPSYCKKPKVSIIMPVFNHPDYFRKSLSSAINQDYTDDYEIIVVDNNDQTDGPTSNQVIVEEFRNPKVLYYKNEKNIGMFGNWNRGIELARASFVTYCHDDDMLLPSALSRLMELQKKTGDKAIFSAYNKMDDKETIFSSGEYISKRKWGMLVSCDYYPYTLFNQFISSAGFGVGCLFSRKCLLEIGGYDSEFYPSSDYAMQAHYTFRYGSVYNCIPTFNYRVAENESLTVYDKFAEVDRHFRDCMKKHIGLPNFVLNRIIKANYNISKIKFAILWGKKYALLANRIRLSDRLIMSIVNKLLAFRRYKLSLKLR